MRYEGNRKSSNDKDVDVYLISLGLKELELLYGIIKNTRRYIPLTLEMMPTRGRLRNFQKTIEEIIEKNYEKTKKI